MPRTLIRDDEITRAFQAAWINGDDDPVFFDLDSPGGCIDGLPFDFRKIMRGVRRRLRARRYVRVSLRRGRK